MSKVFENLCKAMFFILILGILSGCKKTERVVESNSEKTTPIVQPDNDKEPIQGVTEPNQERTLPDNNNSQSLRFEVQEIASDISMSTPFMTKEEFPVLDGSTANIPLGEEIYTYLTGATIEEARKDLKFYKTSESYYRLQSGEADILIVYEPSQDVLDEIADGKDFLFKPIGRDALVFIANAENPVNSLTQQEIIDIYSGKTTNWSMVGGNDVEIYPFQRPESSGSQSLMEKLAVHSDVIMDGPIVVRPEDMGDLIDYLATYTNDNNALGYSVYYYANFMYTKPDLKLLSVDGVEPNNKTIQKQQYPYVNDFYVVIRRDEPEGSKARLIYNWLTTNEGQEHVVSSGYVPVIDIEAMSEEDIIDKLAGTLDLGGNYFILHESDGNGIIIGDRVMDEQMNCVISFPGKRILLPDDNLVVKPDDIITLESYKEIEGPDASYYYTTSIYELYSLKERKYITDKMFHHITRTDSGYYICYISGANHIVISPEGKLILSLDFSSMRYASVSIVGENIFALSNDESLLRIYNMNGKVIREVKLEGDFYINQAEKNYGNSYLIDTSYLLLDEFTRGYGYLYDETGELADSKKFLINTKYAGTTIDCWVMDATRGQDGKLYIVGNIAGNIIVACEDGRVLYETDTPQVNINFLGNCVCIYDRTGESDRLYLNLYDESITFSDEDKPKIEYNQVIIEYPDYLLVYVLNEKGAIHIELPPHEELRIEYYEYSKIIPGMVPYALDHLGEEKRYTYYKGRVYDGYYYGNQVEDYAILNSYKKPSYVVDRDGNEIYKGYDGETVINLLLGTEIYLYVEEGNYIGIKDLQGNYIYRQYAAHLIND